MTFLSVKLALELWTKDALQEELVEGMQDLINEHANDLAKDIGNLSSIHLGHLIGMLFILQVLFMHVVFIDVFSLVISNKSLEFELIRALLEKINERYNDLDIKSKATLFFSLSHLDLELINELSEANSLLEKLIYYFEKQIKYMELNEALVVLEGLKRLSYKRRIIDDITNVHLIPKFPIIR
ncbi:hypothetical protein BEWA_036890 [Theileria equi strain WA]|uniref:Uncharacterized protein n=1 Tax=Theileria equi strain WA TaxID=1537102 RepID=L1LEP6_THEEQ|nr:hypothetical protein BEWA_036890 [Theileria equi strain WA]EKX73653.1 hypothetical protein BEWA_036890 [Theileria equi strain WA]|eukprot:XP_004833105.1 hypothetical protein BEWA_036890 [Theileria equi strain WA]